MNPSPAFEQFENSWNPSEAERIPLSMLNFKKLTLIAAVPVLLGGWALFRPELLFIDQKVSETLPATANATATPITSGAFESYAHETTGKAAIVSVGDKRYLRLTDFKTSNGPDVHVYLVKGTSGDQNTVNSAGFLDLGSIKGNVGDQNYELPTDADPGTYRAVAIWCKRFGVDFGGADLKPELGRPSEGSMRAQTRQPGRNGFRLAAYGTEIVVTSGTLTPGRGTAALIEKDGQRFLRVKGFKSSTPNLRVLLVKAETIDAMHLVEKSEKIDLGALKAGPVQLFPVAKDVDVWLYRSVSLWNQQKQKSEATTALRSDQEKHKALDLA